MYYCLPQAKNEVKGFWCHGCYSEYKGDFIDLEGNHLQKELLDKRKNSDEVRACALMRTWWFLRE